MVRMASKGNSGSKTESVPLGELKTLSEERMLLFDEEVMSFAMGIALPWRIRTVIENYINEKEKIKSIALRH